jgi:hypothetical protein
MKKLAITLLFVFLSLPVVQAQEAESEGPILSGEVRAYTDEVNHFTVKVPVELKDPAAAGSPVLTFEGPLYRGGSLSYHVNTVHMPSVPSETMFGINKGQTEKDPFYTDVKVVKIPGGMGYMFKEVNTERGGAAKTPESIHRWHLAAFGNGRYYNCTLAGSLSCFDDPVVTKAYEAIINSFQIK